MSVEGEIRKIVERETRAWGTKDAALLLTVFHPDWSGRGREGHDFHWKGRACKVYSKTGDEWKMTMHAGLLDYEKSVTWIRKLSHRHRAFTTADASRVCPAVKVRG